MFGFLGGLIPLWARWAALAAALAFVGVWHVKKVHDARVEGRAEVQAKWDADIAAREVLVAKDKLRREEANMGVLDAYRKQTQRAAAAASAANDELGRLRDAIARNSQDSTATAGTDETGTGELLAECASRYTEVAADADRVVLKLTALQQYVSRVCLVEGE